MAEKRSESLASYCAEGERQASAFQSDYELWSDYLPFWEKKVFSLLGWYYMINRAWIILVFGVAMIVIAIVSRDYEIPPIASITLAGSGFLLGIIAVLELLRK